MVVLEQSPWYNEILERGREKGREEGRDEGLHEGLAKGREEGREEGRIDLLQRMIERRFGPLPERLATRLAHLSREQVETVLDVALTAPSLEALLHALDAADGREPESQG
jgi:predicted transposase YdaD